MYSPTTLRTFSTNRGGGLRLEPLGQVRLEVESPPVPRGRRLARAAFFRERARTPVRRVSGLGLQRACDGLLHPLVADRSRAAGTQLIVKPFDPAFGEALTPRLHGWAADAEPIADFGVVQPVGRGQHDARLRRERLRSLPPPRPARELGPLVFGQSDRDCLRSRAADAVRDWYSQYLGAPSRERPIQTRDTSESRWNALFDLQCKGELTV